MVTFLIILMMACNLWVLFYLTWEHKERSKAADGMGNGQRQATADDIMGKSRFRMPERTPQATTSAPNAATKVKSEAVDEKDVTFADELKGANRPTAEKNASRQVPDEDLDKVFEDNRAYDPDEDFDEEPPQAGGSTFDEIDRAAKTVKDTRAKETDVLQLLDVGEVVLPCDAVHQYPREAVLVVLHEYFLLGDGPARSQVQHMVVVRVRPVRSARIVLEAHGVADDVGLVEGDRVGRHLVIGVPGAHGSFVRVGEVVLVILLQVLVGG